MSQGVGSKFTINIRSVDNDINDAVLQLDKSKSSFPDNVKELSDKMPVSEETFIENIKPEEEALPMDVCVLLIIKIFVKYFYYNNNNCTFKIKI